MTLDAMGPEVGQLVKSTYIIFEQCAVKLQEYLADKDKSRNVERYF